MKVLLTVNTGEEVVRGVLPPFNEPPEVLFWGLRVFRLHRWPTETEDWCVYREVWSAALLEMNEGWPTT